MSDLNTIEEVNTSQDQSVEEGQSTGESKSKKRDKDEKKTTILLLLLIILLLGIIGGGIAWYMANGGQEKSYLAREEEALSGQLAALPQEDWQGALDELVEKGQVLVSIDAEPVFEENGKLGRIAIQNDPANLYSFKVTLTEDATGDVLYETGLIDPGYYLEYITLNKELSAGDHGVTAVFTTYSIEETPDPIANISAKLTFHVMDGNYYN